MKFEKYIFGESVNGRSIAKYIGCNGEVKIVVEKNGESMDGYAQKYFKREADYEAFIDAVTVEKDQIENKARAVNMLLDALQELDGMIERHGSAGLL